MKNIFLKNRFKPIILIFVGLFFLIFMNMDILEAQAQARGEEAQKQKKSKLPPARNYKVSETQAKIKVDGKLDDPAWQKAVKIDLPYEWYPGNNIPASISTECLLTFSKSGLYIAFRCFDPNPKKIRAHLMDRDAAATFLRDDHVIILIDTFNDERRAFEFRVNALGVQMDGIYSELDGVDDFSWDAIWKSAGKVTDFGYVVEIAIPFNQLRFSKRKGAQTWGFSFNRFYPREVRYRICSHPIDWNSSCTLCQFHKMDGLINMSPGRNVEFDPTLTVSRTDERVDFPLGDMETGKKKGEVGMSGHWGITPNLVLNAAVNPDFSHVEADVAQLEVNNRFALYYPEKRPFFLEGTDYFKTPLEAVFTRTVFDPVWGAKVTGKTGKNVFGFFANQDSSNNLLFPSNQDSRSTTIDESVFGGVLRYRRDVGKGSTVGFLYTGRAGSDYYNHVAGLDAFMRLAKSKSLNFQFLRSQTRYPQDIAHDFMQNTGSFGGNALYLNFSHRSRHLLYGFDYKNISDNFRADYGFIPRVNLKSIEAFFEPILWGKSGAWFNRLSIQLNGKQTRDQNENLTDQSFGVELEYFGPLQTRLIPSFNFQKEFYKGVTYDKKLFHVFFDTRPVNGLMMYVYASVGDSIDYSNSRLADLLFLQSNINMIIGKSLNIDLLNTYERLSLGGEKVYSANLLQTKIIYNFHRRTFVRAILQYTDINRNLDLYTFSISPETKKFFTQFLFSYKINPHTVLFLGYSDNYFGERDVNMTRRDRTFFLKIGYALAL